MEEQLASQITKIVEGIVTDLDELDELREDVIALSRKLNRMSGKAIARIVNLSQEPSLIKGAREFKTALDIKLSKFTPFFGWNTVNDGLEEFTEMELLYAIISDRELPSPQSLNIPSSIWINAFCDTIGELRRVILRLLISQKVENARKYLDIMNLMFENIIGIEYGKHVAGNLRKKIDYLRVTIERTESDFLHSMLGNQIQDSLDASED